MNLSHDWLQKWKQHFKENLTKKNQSRHNVIKSSLSHTVYTGTQ